MLSLWFEWRLWQIWWLFFLSCYIFYLLHGKRNNENLLYSKKFFFEGAGNFEKSVCVYMLEKIEIGFLVENISKSSFPCTDSAFLYMYRVVLVYTVCNRWYLILRNIHQYLKLKLYLISISFFLKTKYLKDLLNFFSCSCSWSQNLY